MLRPRLAAEPDRHAARPGAGRPALARRRSSNSFAQRWGFSLGKLLYRLLGSLDLIKEEEKSIFVGGGPGPVRGVRVRGLEVEPEQFTPDREWMPRLVLMAKNAYVWLDQLSRAVRARRSPRSTRCPTRSWTGSPAAASPACG